MASESYVKELLINLGIFYPYRILGIAPGPPFLEKKNISSVSGSIIGWAENAAYFGPDSCFSNPSRSVNPIDWTPFLLIRISEGNQDSVQVMVRWACLTTDVDPGWDFSNTGNSK